MREQSVRRQGWLEAGKDMPKNPELNSEIRAHARESVDWILNDISRIEANQGKRLIDKVRSNVARARRRKTA